MMIQGGAVEFRVTCMYQEVRVRNVHFQRKQIFDHTQDQIFILKKV